MWTKVRSKSWLRSGLRDEKLRREFEAWLEVVPQPCRPLFDARLGFTLADSALFLIAVHSSVVETCESCQHYRRYFRMCTTSHEIRSRMQGLFAPVQITWSSSLLGSLDSIRTSARFMTGQASQYLGPRNRTNFFGAGTYSLIVTTFPSLQKLTEREDSNHKQEALSEARQQTHISKAQNNHDPEKTPSKRHIGIRQGMHLSNYGRHAVAAARMTGI